MNDIGDDQIRKKKIDYVKRYGSPNVFDEFDPHVTVGYDDYNGIKSDDKNWIYYLAIMLGDARPASWRLA